MQVTLPSMVSIIAVSVVAAVLPVVLPVSVKRVVPHMNILSPKHISVRNLQNSDQTAHVVNAFHIDLGRSFEYL